MSPLPDKIALVRRARQVHGLREAARVAWASVRHARTTRLFLFALSEPRPPADALAAAKHHRFAFATAAELEAMHQDPTLSIAPVDVERVLSNQARCLLQRDGDALVGYAWIWNSHLAYIEEGFYLNLPNDTRYNYKGFTAEAYRGHAFQAVRHVELLRRLRPEGTRRLFGYVSHLNSSSLQGVVKSGYRRVGELRIAHRLGRVHASLVTERDFWTTIPR